jgi:hypothetical protein
MPEAGHLSGFCRGQGVSAGHSGEYFFVAAVFWIRGRALFREERGSKVRPKADGGKERVCL